MRSHPHNVALLKGAQPRPLRSGRRLHLSALRGPRPAGELRAIPRRTAAGRGSVSLIAAAVCGSIPLRRARAAHSATAVLLALQQAATWRWLNPHSPSKRKISRIFLMVTLRAGISTLLGKRPRMPESEPAPKLVAVLRFTPDGDHLSGQGDRPSGHGDHPSGTSTQSGRLPAGISGRLQSERVVAFDWNQWSPWAGIRRS